MRKLVTVGAALLFMTGCATATPTLQGGTEPDLRGPEELQHDYCETFAGSMQEYADFVSEVMTSGEQTIIDTERWAKLDGELSRLDTLGLSSDWRDAHTDYMSMRRQLNAVINEGGGDVSLSSTDYKSGAVRVIKHCVDAGYSAAD